ncbi:MAG: efflux RND transporter periplasmic adaptor subunit [Phycisphaerae bacterium]
MRRISYKAKRPTCAGMMIASLICSTGITVAQGPPATKVVLSKAESVDAPVTITLVGSLTPLRQSRVGSEVQGLIAEMPVRQGDQVEAGAVICQLNADALRHQLDEAKARLGSLEAMLNELKAGTRKENLRRLRAQLEEAEADYERWRAELDRVESLYKGTNSNAKEMYDTKADYLRSQRRKIAAEAAFNLGVEGPRVEAIERAKYDVDAQQAVVNRIQSDLEKATIRAPFAGYVSNRFVEVGEWLSVGDTVVELVDLSTMLARVPVPESALPFVQPGTGARVKVDALGDTLNGTIKHIMRLADATARTFPVDIEVQNSQMKLAAGMFVRATVPCGQLEKAIAVPKDAILQKDGTDYVAITMPGRQGGTSGMLMPVTTGIDVGGSITITSGNVRPGMSVITRGNERMLPFPMPVIVVDEHGSPIAMPSGGRPSEGGPPGSGQPESGTGRGGAGRGGIDDERPGKNDDGQRAAG